MPATPDTPIYDKVVRITDVYLGPAAERFIARQVQNHLHKSPESLTRDDLSQLIDWIKVAVSLLTDDSEIIEEYINRLEQLSQASPPDSGLAMGTQHG